MGNIAVGNGLMAPRLSEGRTVLGLTTEDVSEVMEISVEDLHKMETGEMTVSPFHIRRFARLYRRNVAWLLGEEADPELNDEAIKLIDELGEISPEDKEKVLSFARFLASNPAKQ